MKKTIIFLLFALAVNIVSYAQDAFYYYDGKRIPLTENASKIVVICNVLELVDNFGFLISFFFDKFIC